MMRMINVVVFMGLLFVCGTRLVRGELDVTLIPR